jgi:hypothetical protein
MLVLQDCSVTFPSGAPRALAQGLLKATKRATEKTWSVSQAAPPVRYYPNSNFSQAKYPGTLDNE